MATEDFCAGGTWSWSCVAAPRGLGCVLVASESGHETAWVIAPPAVSLQVDEPEELREQWRVARFDAPAQGELVIALGEHVAGSYHDLTVDDVRSVVPVDLHDWISLVCARQRALADGFGRHDPRVAPNEEHVRAASTRFEKLAGATESSRRAHAELQDAVVEVPDTVDELLGRATRKGGAEPTKAPSAGVVAPAFTTLSAPVRQDAIALSELLTTAHVERERPGSAEHSYLDDAIAKPWGVEYRVYDDALIDVWLMQLNAGTQTSMHCHARKDTFQACLHGDGMLIGGDGRRIPIAPGSVIHIQPGAAHRTLTCSGMTLVEIETPRDKLDHLRLEDDNGRTGQAYEGDTHAQRRLDPLKDVTHGPPRARLRPHATTQTHQFALERGLDLEAEGEGLMFAISLDVATILRREITIHGPQALTTIRPEHTYLTIRTTARLAASRGRSVSPGALRRAGAANASRRRRELCESFAAEDHQSPTTTRAVIVTAAGLHDHDTIAIYHRMKEAGFDVEVASAGTQPIMDSPAETAPRRQRPTPGIALKGLDADKFDVVVLTGGHEAPDSVRPERDVLQLVRAMDADGKVVAGLCDGPWVMISAGIVRGRRVSVPAGLRDHMINAGAEIQDADVIVDDNIVTCSHHRAAGPFIETIIQLCENSTLAASAASQSSAAADRMRPRGPSSCSHRALIGAAWPHRHGNEGRVINRRLATRRLQHGGVATLIAAALAVAVGWLSNPLSLRSNSLQSSQTTPRPDTAKPTGITPTRTPLASTRPREDRTKRRSEAARRAVSPASKRRLRDAAGPREPAPPAPSGVPVGNGGAPADRDYDGTPNRQDACPTKFGSTANGCPSGPGESVAALPSVAARPTHTDKDGDGIINRLDMCPRKPAATATSGCPTSASDEPVAADPTPIDKDGDGIINRLDACLTNPGSTANGCPETTPPA